MTKILHPPQLKNVGAGLLAKAVYQQQISCLTHRHRRQASSHTYLCMTKVLHPPQLKNVGAGLLAKAVYQQQIS
ncbi:MAG: hypothetical protein WBM22_05655 [Pseudomonas fluorescens]